MADPLSGAGKLLRLKPLGAKDIPSHPELAEQQPTPVDASTFVGQVLDEAFALVDQVIPGTFKEQGTKSSSPSKAKVELFSGHYPEGAEEWFGRRSLHVNEETNGSAAYAEFDNGLRKNHSYNESEYTPNIFDGNQILDWDLSGVKHPKYSEISLNVWEMFHSIPFPFENRVFNTLVITAKNGDQSFLVAQIPVDKSSFSSAVLEKSHQDPSTGKFREREGNGSWKISSALTTGMYTSVERVTAGHKDQQANPPGKKVGENEVLWEMATASDAAGKIPDTMQRLAMPGQIAKDVGLVLGWVERNRRSRKAAS